jgi:hypothetical protein
MPGWRRLLCCLLLCAGPQLPVWADVPPLAQIEQGTQAAWAQWLIEDGQQLELQQVQNALRQGRFSPGTQQIPSFGIGSPAIWLYLPLENTGSTHLQRRLALGTSWLDAVDVYLIDPTGTLWHWHAGDSLPNQRRAEPGIGFNFSLELKPGSSSLFLRTATVDPLLLPVRLLSEEAFAAEQSKVRYGFGILYGFLLALLTYNLLLYAGLRQQRYLDYSLYLLCFLLLNIAYTGHGFLWLWPEQLQVQRYVIFVWMLLFGYSGLRFAASFLNLPQQAPAVNHGLHWFCRLSLGALLLAIALQRQELAAQIAFSFALLYTFGMLALGLITRQYRHIAGRYYLLAVACGALGAAITTLAVWGKLPFNRLTYHAAPLGIMAEGYCWRWRWSTRCAKTSRRANRRRTWRELIR